MKKEVLYETIFNKIANMYDYVTSYKEYKKIWEESDIFITKNIKRNGNKIKNKEIVYYIIESKNTKIRFVVESLIVNDDTDVLNTKKNMNSISDIDITYSINNRNNIEINNIINYLEKKEEIIFISVILLD